MKILIIEDCKVTRNLYKKILSGQFELHFETDGLEGFFSYQLAKKNSSPFDLVISDMAMPYMDGAQSINMIRVWEKENKISRWEGIPILISTSLKENNSLMKTAGPDYDSVLTKPVNLNVLEEKIHELIGQYEESIPVFHDMVKFQNEIMGVG